jgi:aspartate/methionine/tyrosine aminotransferase
MRGLATAAENMPRSGIRVILDLALKIPDAIHLEIGQPNFPTPNHICEAAYKATQDGFTGYAPNAGYPSLRGLIADKAQRDNQIKATADNIIVTTGGMGGLFSTFTALLNPGDEILLPNPGYPNFDMAVKLCHANAKLYPLDPANGFQPILEALPGLISGKTKAILINSPSNPTGAVLPQKTIAALVAFAAKNDLYLISDECYEKIIFNTNHVSPASMDNGERVISIFSFSKTYAMTGWRVGYVVAPLSIAPTITKLQEATVACTSSVSQKGAEAAIKGPQDCVAEMVIAYQRRRDKAIAILRNHKLSTYVPEGAFYLLINISSSGMDSDSFARDLLTNEKVAVAPGNTFGPGGAGYIRISLATDDQILETGLERICRKLTRTN